jgi:gamma-glutamyltranspeptidase/glutathione hydrolase
MIPNGFNMNLRQFKPSLGLAVLIALAGCEQQTVPTAAPQVTTIVEQVVAEPAKQFAIAIPEAHAAEAVRKVLASGGNAVDAAVAAGFALAVTFPEAGNIGGGGFMLARMNGRLSFLDYREKAPLAASRDMYLDATGKVVENSSLIGARAAGVPGTVAGLWQAHQKYGTKPWAELLEPSIELARNGYMVDPKTAASVAEAVEWFDGQVNFEQYFGVMQNASLFKQPLLADTLLRLAAEGPSDFYKGETAKLIVAQMQRGGGLISAQDLAAYQAVWRAPISTQWRDYTVVSAPPPSSGGFAVIQLLKMKEFLDEEFAGVGHNSAEYVHLVAEMEKRVFADRAEHFGDPDFVNVPIGQLVSDDYIARRASEVNLTEISDLGDVKPGWNTPSTAHYSIIDQWGNAVSNTYTINWAFGSGVVVEGAGFLLNNEMDDFSAKPGVPNVYGVVGGVANEIQPSKRMLSSMSPTLLIKDDKVDMVVGTPGGSTIFTSVFQAIVNISDFGMTADQAVAASRFHHQLFPPELITESISLPLPEQTKLALLELGYRVEPHAWEFGDLQVISRSDGRLTAASDPRGIGASFVMEIDSSE